MKSRGSKCQWLDLHDNEKEEDLDEFEGDGEGKSIGYVPLAFIAPPQKELNRPTDMGEGTKSLNDFLCISKIGYLYNCLFCIRVPRE